MLIAVWHLNTARTASLERPSFIATGSFGWVLAFKRRERSQR